MPRYEVQVSTTKGNLRRAEFVTVDTEHQAVMLAIMRSGLKQGKWSTLTSDGTFHRSGIGNTVLEIEK